MCWVTKVSNQTIEKWTSRYQAFAGGSCCPALDFTATKVSNMDLSWSIDRQLCGPSTDKEFLLPGSCHPWAPAVGQLEVLRQSKSTPHCCQSLRRANVGFGASISSNRTSGSAPYAQVSTMHSSRITCGVEAALAWGRSLWSFRELDIVSA